MCILIQCHLSWVITIKILLYSLKVKYRLQYKIIEALTFMFSLNKDNIKNIKNCQNSWKI